jgi:hypothetical protein
MSKRNEESLGVVLISSLAKGLKSLGNFLEKQVKSETDSTTSVPVKQTQTKEPVKPRAIRIETTRPFGKVERKSNPSVKRGRKRRGTSATELAFGKRVKDLNANEKRIYNNWNGFKKRNSVSISLLDYIDMVSMDKL